MRTAPGIAPSQPSYNGSDDRPGRHRHDETPVGAEHTEALIAAIASERHQHCRQRHSQRQAAGDLDVHCIQQHDRRDEQLAAGHPHERGDDADTESGDHAGDRIRFVNVVNETADVGAPQWPDSPHRRPAIAGCLLSGRRADSRSSHPRVRLRRDCSLMRQVRMVAPSSPTDGCVEAAGAGPRARRLVHREPHTTTWRFREGQPVDVAVVASVLCRHTTTSIAAAHAGWRASSIPQGRSGW